MPRIFEHIIVRSARDTNGTLIGGTSSPPGLAAPLAIVASIDNLGVAIVAGIVGDIYLPFSGVITGWTLLADQIGSITLDLWKDVYANFPPTVADTITAAAKPAIVAGNAMAQSAVLTGWTTAFSAGDAIRVNVDAAATVTRVLMTLSGYRT